MPIERIASAIGIPCDVTTSTCRNFATISSGLCLFLAICSPPRWQSHTSSRTTSLGVGQIGDARKAQGKLQDALESYETSLSLRDQLVKADGTNMDWQADLAASHGKLGQLFMELNQPDEALALFKKGRSIVVAIVAREKHPLW